MDMKKYWLLLLAALLAVMPAAFAAGGSDNVITFSQSGITCGSTSCAVSGERVVIAQPGRYVLKGEAGDAGIDVTADGLVELALNGVSLTSHGRPVIGSSKDTQLVITSLSGTENSFCRADEEPDDKDAAVQAEGHILLEGEGTIRISAEGVRGLYGGKDVSVKVGTVVIESGSEGIVGKHSVSISGGSVTVTSRGDGIKSNGKQGTIMLSGGKTDIVTECDAIRAKSEIVVNGGETTVRASGENAKGLKCDGTIRIGGGRLTIDSDDDGIHAAGEITVTDGTIGIKTGDDALHSDTRITVTGGAIDVSESYEGLEACVVVIEGGDIRISSDDDGINAAGDSDPEGPLIHITGGSIRVNALGDGLDSNMDIVIDGGLIIADGPDEARNAALDCGSENGGRLVINGGQVLAICARGMQESPDTESRNSRFLCECPYTAGDEIVITDEAGSVRISYTALKSGSTILYSDEAMRDGDSFTVTAGSRTVEATADREVIGFRGMPFGGKDGWNRPGHWNSGPEGKRPDRPQGFAPVGPGDNNGQVPGRPDGNDGPPEKMPEPPQGDMPGIPGPGMPENAPAGADNGK